MTGFSGQYMAGAISTDNKKILYVEILRIIAVIFVIFNHTGKLGYMYFTWCDPASFSYWSCMFFSVFCKFSVPMFFMISGMMLLGKEEPVSVVWKKRILKYVIILILFSILDYSFNNVLIGEKFSVSEFFILLYSKGVIEPLWFLYVYIAFLMMLPFLRKLAQHMTAREFNYLIVLQIIFSGLINIVDFLIFKGEAGINGTLVPANLIGITVFYPLIGYYLGNILNKVTPKMFRISFILFIIATILTMLITDYRLRLTGETSADKVETFYFSLLAFEVIFIFLLVRKLFENRTLPDPVQKLVIMLGDSVFGIYLLEGIIRECLFGVLESLKANITPFPAVWIFVLIVFAACSAIVFPFNCLTAFLKSRISTSNKSGKKSS